MELTKLTDEELDIVIASIQDSISMEETVLRHLNRNLEEYRAEKQRRWEAKLTPKEISNL